MTSERRMSVSYGGEVRTRMQEHTKEQMKNFLKEVTLCSSRAGKIRQPAKGFVSPHRLASGDCCTNNTLFYQPTIANLGTLKWGVGRHS